MRSERSPRVARDSPTHSCAHTHTHTHIYTRPSPKPQRFRKHEDGPWLTCGTKSTHTHSHTFTHRHTQSHITHSHTQSHTVTHSHTANRPRGSRCSRSCQCPRPQTCDGETRQTCLMTLAWSRQSPAVARNSRVRARTRTTAHVRTHAPRHAQTQPQSHTVTHTVTQHNKHPPSLSLSLPTLQHGHRDH